MYKIVNGDTVLATVNTPVWVKKQDNGSFALCEEPSAHGLVVDGTVYHIAGRPKIDGSETIVFSEISEATYQKEQAAVQADLAEMTCNMLYEIDKMELGVTE